MRNRVTNVGYTLRTMLRFYIKRSYKVLLMFLTHSLQMHVIPILLRLFNTQYTKKVYQTKDIKIQ